MELYGYAPIHPDIVDDRRNVRSSVITALELRVFRTPDAKGVVRFEYMAKDNILYSTAVKLLPDGNCVCPCCGLPATELMHHPTDRGLVCPCCVKRNITTKRQQAQPAPKPTANVSRVTVGTSRRPAKPAPQPAPARKPVKVAHTCSAINSRGKQCGCRVKAGQQYCSHHKRSKWGKRS